MIHKDIQKAGKKMEFKYSCCQYVRNLYTLINKLGFVFFLPKSDSFGVKINIIHFFQSWIKEEFGELYSSHVILR